MKSLVSCLATCCIAVGIARANTVKETLTGTIAGGSTVDTNGYFGQVGANLTGVPVKMTIEYVTQDFNSILRCVHSGCVIHLADVHPQLVSSVLLTVKINGRTLTYRPAHEGEVVIGPSTDYYTVIASDAEGSYPDPGGYVYLRETTQPKFGAQLSPGLNNDNDSVNFVAPNFANVETLNFFVQTATRVKN